MLPAVWRCYHDATWPQNESLQISLAVAAGLSSGASNVKTGKDLAEAVRGMWRHAIDVHGKVPAELQRPVRG